MCCCCLEDLTELADTVICGPEGHLCTEASSVLKTTTHALHAQTSHSGFVINTLKHAMTEGFWCAACMSAWFLLTCVYLSSFVIFVSGGAFSPRAGGWVVMGLTVENISRIHSDNWLMLCWKGQPMTSFTLTHCLFDPDAVSVAYGFSARPPP